MDFTIANHLASLRRAHGYSQEGLAAELGLTRQAISRWERGESLPDTENLIALADLYGVTLDELVRPEAGLVGDVAESDLPADAPSPTEPDDGTEEGLQEVIPEPAELQESAPENLSTQSYLTLPDNASAVPSGIGPTPEESPATPPKPTASRAGVWAVRIMVGLLGALILVALGTCALAGVFGMMSSHTESTIVAPIEMTVNPEEVRSLRIDWQAGPVEVVAEDGIEQVYVTEDYLNDELAEYPLGLEVTAHDELIVDCCLPDALSVDEAEGKRLTVRVPRSLAQDLDVVSCTLTSGRLDMSGIACKSLDLQLGSGDIRTDGVTAETLKLQVGAGQTRIEGSFSGSIEATVQSGRVRISSSVVPASTDLDATSGTIDYRLPADARFRLRAESTSGSVDVEYEGTQKGDTYLVGKGGNPIEAHVTSGNIAIRPF